MSSDETRVRSSPAEAAAPAPGVSLSLRLSLAFFLTAFLLVLTASAILYVGTLTALQRVDDQVIDKRVAAIIALLSQSVIDKQELQNKVNDDKEGPRQIFIRVMLSPERAIESQGMARKLPATVFPAAQADPPARMTLTLPSGENYRLKSRLWTSTPPGRTATIQVGTDTTLDEASLAEFRRILMMVIGAALPLTAFLSWFMVGRELKPLARISAATRTIDASNLGYRIDLTRMPAELHDLGTNFNAMLGRLETALNDLENYADNIAHEIRTPLNRIRLANDIALDEAKTADELRNTMTTNAAECARLTRLLNGLLFLARAGKDQLSFPSAPIDPRREINTVHEFFKDEASEKGIALIQECVETGTILADRDLFKQIIANLISNALKHTPSGGEVRVTCRRSAQEILIEVADTGSGIAAHELPHIFERFYRAGSPKEDSGLGLGLAIVKSITELYRGRISVSSELGRGTAFRLAFPAIGPMLTGEARHSRATDT
jgi:two-component system heavy metal sensor histidine kinase CusS